MKRYGVAFRSSCTGPSSWSEPAAPFSRYRTGISWQTTKTTCVGQLEQAPGSRRVASCGVVEALAAGEGLVAPVGMLPRAVLVERRAVEVADVDVVEERLDDERNLAARERDLGGLERAAEPRVHAGVERNVRELEPELARLLPAEVRKADRTSGVAAHAPLAVERGLGVAGEDEEPHQITNASRRASPRAKRSSANGERSSVGSRPATSSARCSPTAGACWKPWPENPVA